MTMDLPDWVTFPEDDWVRITPAEAGLDPQRFDAFIGGLDIRGGDFGGEDHSGNKWGAVLTRGGYLVHEWGDRNYRFHTASVGKAFSWALIGFAAEDGLLDPDEPINRSWTGEGQLSHPHKYLDRGHHERLTWKHVIGPKEKSEHYGGFAIELGLRWMKRESGVRETTPGVPGWVKVDRRPLLRPLFPRRARHRGPILQRRILAALTGPDGGMGPRSEGRAGREALRKDRHPPRQLGLAARRVREGPEVLLPHHPGLLYVPGPALRDRRQRGAQRPWVGRHERLRPREVRPPERHPGHLEG